MFRFGDVLRLSDEYIQKVPTCYKDRRVMYVGKEVGIHATCVIVRLDGREGSLPGDEPGAVRNIELLAWEVADA